MKRLWLVRAGRQGERELASIEQNRLLPGFDEIADLSSFPDRQAILEHLIKTSSPDAKKKSLIAYAGQRYTFVHKIQVDDLVMMPRKRTNGIAIGKVTGDYIFKSEDSYKHSREVEWLKESVPRDTFKQDLIYSMGAFTTVCEIKRNSALERVVAVLEDGKDPGALMENKSLVAAQTPDEDTDEDDYGIDFEDVACQQIISLIKSEFTGHELADLVAEILRVRGYTTKVSPPGPDQGVDILAAGGNFGLSEDLVCVQVKSGEGQANQNVAIGLLGAVTNVGAQTGLLVSISGVNSPAQKFLDRNFSKLRLWQADDLLKALFQSYGGLSEQTREKIPLKRIYVPISNSDV